MRTTMLLAVVLGVGAVAGLIVPSAASAQEFNMGGVQVWNIPYWDTVSIGDYFGPNYKIDQLQPVTLVGARNGVFSGQLVVTNSNGAISDLKVTTTELKQVGENASGRIPAERISVRYAERAEPQTSWAPHFRYDRLLDAAPQEVPIFDVKPHRAWKPKNEGPVAAITVWFTVRVPKDAAAGEYEGMITLEGQNMAVEPVKVPLKLTVHDFVVPEPRDFQTRNLGWMSPDRVAMHYNVPVWSDKHFELMAPSMAMLAELGSRQVFINLVVNYPSQSNTETMIKWVKQDDGSFKYDFTAFDRYLDLVDKTIGKPWPIRLNMWCPERKEDPKLPQVLMLDPKTGQTSPLDQPAPIGSPESYRFWKPVMDEIKARLEKRGWFDVMGPNWHEYCGGPTPMTVSMVRRIWPDTKWISMDHGRRTAFAGLTPEDRTVCFVNTTVWNEGSMQARGYSKGLAPGVAYTGHHRGRNREWSDLWAIRLMVEEMLMRGTHGIDPIGGDLWPAEVKGRIVGGNWAAAALGPGNSTRAFLAPGPKGAIGTERFEALREGIQIAETILFVQDALNSGKVEGDLAQRANKVLDERSAKIFEIFPAVGAHKHQMFSTEMVAKAFMPEAQQRESELFAVAADIAKVLGKN